MIRLAKAGDAAALCAIYNHFVSTTTITFEEEEVDIGEMAQRVSDVQRQLCWYVCELGGQILGYAYATPWKARSAYRYSVESTVYVAPGQGQRGIGKALYQKLLADLKARGIHSVIGGIAQPNAASVALHEALGFVKVAHFHQVGKKFGEWVDVGYWELLFPDVSA